jgi:catechol 2,3-dioxygenase-like lactoylglutathione lyase family enzyme
MTLLAAMVAGAGAVQQAPSPPTFENQTVAVWKTLHSKLLQMARDFPEGKYDWKPHSDSRNMVEEFRHVTIGLEMSTAQLAGEPFDYVARLKSDEGKPRTRESVVKEMEAALTKSFAAVEKTPSPRLVFWIDHQAEHYGKLVSNYRMNGLVPPISRPRGRGGAPSARVTTVALRVHDTKAMVAFYSEAFGATFREVDTGTVRSHFGEVGGLTLKLVPIRDAADFEGFPVHQLGFEVADIDRVVAIARKHGGRVQNPPQEKGGRVHAAIRDPDGNTVELYALTGK